mmetsp:Transcript_27730/g.81518  ORF Transcript_27730/g.81518 Transcript_27730/m.81518 type:complete len:89 (+) Transcript_27730:1-267(+)
MGADACDAACTLIAHACAYDNQRGAEYGATAGVGQSKACPSPVVIDPFCGHGTAIAVANEFGLDSLGVELSRKRCRAAQTLTILKAPG